MYVHHSLSGSQILTEFKEKEIHDQIFGRDYTAPSNWYHAYMGNMNEEDEKGGNLNLRSELPAL